MYDSGVPMIRLELEAMRYSVVHTFTSHQKGVEEQLDKALKTVLDDFDFEAEVNRIATDLLRKAVKDAVTSAVSAICYQKEVQEMLQAGAAQKVREAIKKALE